MTKKSPQLPRSDDRVAMIDIDARIVAEGLGLAPEDVEPARKAGTLTTLCERGTGSDVVLGCCRYREHQRFCGVVQPPYTQG